MLKYIISVLSVCLVISSCVPCESDSGSGGSTSSSSSSSSSGSNELECPKPECIRQLGALDMAGTPCNADHDCARWSPCVDARCDFDKPQSDGLVDFPGSCDIKLQTEPVYCGRTGSGINFVCSAIGECCPEN